VFGAWAYSDDPGASDPVALITQTTGPVLIYDAGWYSALEGPGLTEALFAAARGGREIRLLSARPTRDLEALVEHPGITVRPEMTCGRPPSASRTRCCSRYGSPTRPLSQPPLLALRRATSDGLFDRLSDHLDVLWGDSDESVDGVEDLQDSLDARFTNDHDEDKYAGYPNTGPDDPLEASDQPEPAPPLPTPDATTKPGSTDSGGEAGRRWPRRGG
jgi:hypothetical protein